MILATQKYLFSRLFVPWNIRSHDGTFVLRTFVPWNFHSRYRSFPGTFTPWTVLSLELSFLGPFVPGPFVPDTESYTENSFP